MRGGTPQACSVLLLSLRQAVEWCKSSVHLAMLDVQGEEESIFASDDVLQLLHSRRVERLMVGVHGSSPLDLDGKRRRRDAVVNALHATGYRIVYERLSFPDQPDGLVVAAAPHVELTSEIVRTIAKSGGHDDER